eukprot:TRINITY_DN12008_c0_g1_i1.p1 TRINITY_DN12008_c0_g1~~TRINITY_DN12008_c0_g1_i1.p1  ORF type:complete len:181 (+),score=7.30 TRINITY_DN12008_c0_g1_i1:37-543(+)
MAAGNTGKGLQYWIIQGEDKYDITPKPLGEPLPTATFFSQAKDTNVISAPGQSLFLFTEGVTPTRTSLIFGGRVKFRCYSGDTEIAQIWSAMQQEFVNNWSNTSGAQGVQAIRHQLFIEFVLWHKLAGNRAQAKQNMADLVTQKGLTGVNLECEDNQEEIALQYTGKH